jgi:hypothetical protein
MRMIGIVEAVMVKVWFTRTNRVSGYLLALMMLVLFGGIALAGRPEGEKGFLGADFIGPVVCYAGLIFFVRPEVAAGPAALRLRGPLMDTVIPWLLISGFESAGKYMVVSAGGERYRAHGVESMNFQLMFGRRTPVGSMREELDRYRRERAAAATATATGTGTATDDATDYPVVSQTYVRPSPLEIVLLPVWALILSYLWWG